ncbi:MAG: hypothetical protein ACFFAX_06590 [Promethearchaeota archaeon]
MQSPEIVLSNELFTVAVFLWVGTFSLLFWLFIRMNGLSKTMKMLSITSAQGMDVTNMPSKLLVYFALVLELIGVTVLLAGLFVWIPIPLFAMSMVIWAGVFILLFWQMISLASIEESLNVLIAGASQE